MAVKTPVQQRRPRATEVVFRALLIVAALSVVTSCGAAQPPGPNAASTVPGGPHLRIEPQLGHGDVVSFATFSSTGAFLLTGSADHTVILWDGPTGAQLRTIDLPDDADAVAATMTDDARWALIATNRRAAIVVDLVQGTRREVTLSGSQPAVLARALPGSHTAVTVDQDGVVRAWDLDAATATRQGSIGQEVAHAAMGPGGRALVTAARGGALTLFDLSAFAVRRSWPGGEVAQLALSADEGTAFALTPTGDVISWDTATGAKKATHSLSLSGRSGTRHAEFTPDGQRLVVVVPEEAQLVEVTTGKLEHRIPWGYGVDAVAIEPSGRRVLISTRAALSMWDTTNPSNDTATLGTHFSGVHEIAVSADGSRALWATNDGRFYAWDGDTAGLIAAGRTPLIGTVAVCSRLPCFVHGSGNGTLEIRDLPSGEVRKTIARAPDADTVRAVAISPDDRYAWAARSDGSIVEIDLAQGSEVRVLPASGTAAVTAIEISPDGRELLVASGERVQVQDTGDGHVLRSIPEPTGSAREASVSPDGRLLAIATPPAVRLFDRVSGQATGSLGDLRSAGPVAWLPGGLSLLVGGHDGTVRRWDLATGRAIQSFEGFTAPVEAVRVLAGATHAMAIANGVVRIWKLATGASLAGTASGGEWLVYTDDGMFDGSPLGGDLAVAIDGMTPLSLDGLAAAHDRPDVLLERVGLGTPDTIARFRRLHDERLRALGLAQRPASASTPPTIALEHFEIDDKEVEVAFRVSGTSPLASYRMLVNDVPVPDAFDVPLRGREQRVVERLELSAGTSRMEFQAFDQTGAASAPWTREVQYSQRVKGSLYYLGFGVAHYHDAQLAAGAADRDVIDVGAAFDQMGLSFESVNVRSLVDDQVTVDAVHRSRAFLKSAKVDDTVVVFVAGQGATVAGECQVFTSATQPTTSPSSTIPLSAFREVLASTSARKQLLWVDACGRKATAPSAEVAPSTNADAAEGAPARMIDVDLAHPSGSFVLMSARPSETTYEEGQPRHGAFAAALLAALTTGAADTDRDTSITTDELTRYVMRAVTHDTAQRQHPVVDADNGRMRLALPTLAAGGREYDDRRVAGTPEPVPYQPSTVAPQTFKHTPLFFHPGSLGPMRPLIKERNEAMRLGDGTSYLAWSMSQVSFVPDGKGAAATTLPMHNLLGVAASQDGRRASLVQGYGPLTVVDLPSMGVAWKRDGDTNKECAAAFAGSDTLYFHDSGHHGRLWRMDLGTRKVQAIGPVLNASACWGSGDGKTFVVQDDTAKIGGVYAIDTSSGATTTLTPGPVSLPNASPDGSRVCYVQDRRLQCVRVADRGIELLADNVNDFYHTYFDPTGRRLLFVRTETRDEVKYDNVFCVADFAEKKVYDVRNVQEPWGGDKTLLDGGTGFALGGINGMRVYDLSTLTVSWVSGKNLYLMSPIAGRRSVLIGQEYSNVMHDLFILDLPGQRP